METMETKKIKENENKEFSFIFEIVTEDGKRVEIGHTDIIIMFDIEKYLIGEMTAQQLIEKYKK